MNIKDKIYYTSIWIVLALLIYISWIKGVIDFIISILFYSAIFYLFYFVFQKIKKNKKILNYKIFLIKFIKKISLSILIIIFFLWFFAYYQNNIAPAKMPQFTITNWKKIVIFQSMAHIATPNFYEKIKNQIIKYKKQWFVYFYEWVKPGNTKNTKNFNKALWINFNKDLYKNFSKLYWLTNQNNSIFLWLINNKDYNVDLTLDQIMKLYNQKIKNKSKKELEKQLPKQVIDINTQVTNALAQLNPKELMIIRFINKWLINLIIKNQIIQDSIMNNFSNKTLFNVILQQRNKNIAQTIEKSKYNKIFITYWLMHFKWVFGLLKSNDSKWRISKIKFFYPTK